MEKRHPFQQILREKLDMCRQKHIPQLMSYTCTKISSKCVTDLNVNWKILNLQRKKRENPCEPEVAKELPDLMPKRQDPLKKKLLNWTEFIRLKSFCFMKGLFKCMKR